MSPRVAYWLSSFEPDMEAIASEVALLRRRFRSSMAWGLSPRHGWGSFSWRAGICLHPRLHLLFRVLTRILEPAFQLNHIFGSLGDWFYLADPKRRPTVLTAAAHTPPAERRLLDRVDRFVIEYPGGRDLLRRAGIEDERIRVIVPPVDLKRFVPYPPPADPFTLLFASSPDDAGWLEGRGVKLLLEAASRRPAMCFRLLWRPWGDSLAHIRRWVAERGLTNVEILCGRFSDMASQYQAAHATLLPFVDPEKCKPAPNSLIESLACGRPVLATRVVGLADLVEEGGAGVVCEPAADAVVAGLDRLRGEWNDFSTRSRLLAEQCFAEAHFLDSYHRLYRELLGSGR